MLATLPFLLLAEEVFLLFTFLRFPVSINYKIYHHKLVTVQNYKQSLAFPSITFVHMPAFANAYSALGSMIRIVRPYLPVLRLRLDGARGVTSRT